jgi:hypothetical protein
VEIESSLLIQATDEEAFDGTCFRRLTGLLVRAPHDGDGSLETGIRARRARAATSLRLEDAPARRESRDRIMFTPRRRRGSSLAPSGELRSRNELFGAHGAFPSSFPSPSRSPSAATESYFPRGTTIVTCTATDASGNQATCMFLVVVTATILPRTL